MYGLIHLVLQFFGVGGGSGNGDRYRPKHLVFQLFGGGRTSHLVFQLFGGVGT